MEIVTGKNAQGGLGLTSAVMMFPTPSGLSANQGQGDGELGKAIRTWGTPRATEGKGCGPRGSKSQKHMLEKGYLCAEVSEVESELISFGWTVTPPVIIPPSLRVQLGGTETQPKGQLNPDWVEWLQGLLIGWTDLRPLEMRKFQQWLEQHGDY